MRNNRKIAFFMAVILAIPTITVAFANDSVIPQPLPEYDSIIQSSEGLELLDFFNSNEPIGMVGFEAEYALSDDFNDIVEVIVQFITPPAVALELFGQDNLSRARALYSHDYETQALYAHELFYEQLNQVIMPFNATTELEIFSEHHRLFNGVYMRVPAPIVEQIASLPEVFAIMPHSLPVPPDLPEPNEAFEYTQTPSSLIQPRSSFFLNPNGMMPNTRAQLNINHIHNNLGITGRGVTVVSIDTGVDHRHPEFARFLDNTGRIPGWQFSYNIFHNPNTATNHGTQTLGAIISMAPQASIWSLQRSSAENPGMPYMRAFETAVFDIGADVIYTWGGNIRHPFTPYSAAVTLATLNNGVITVSAVHNFGPSHFTVNQPLSPLGIGVGAGTFGSDYVNTPDDVASFSGRGPVQVTYSIKPDIVGLGQWGRVTWQNGAYGHFSGTSLAGPTVAGITALVVQRYPNANHYEIRSRVMNTARQITGIGGNDVFASGAGFINPLPAITNTSFATATHPIPLTANQNNPFITERMPSLSFGRVTGTQSGIIPVTVHNPGVGNWNVTVRFNGSHAGVNLQMTRTAANTFNARMTFANGTAQGLYQGIITLTNATGTQTLRMPFAVMYGGAQTIHSLNVSIDSPLAGRTVWISSGSGFVNTSSAQVAAGTQVELATSLSGFLGWEVLAGNVNILSTRQDASWAYATFIMPPGNVNIRARYILPTLNLSIDIPQAGRTIWANPETGFVQTSSLQIRPGTRVDIATSINGFLGWEVLVGQAPFISTWRDASFEYATFIMPPGNVNIRARYSPTRSLDSDVLDVDAVPIPLAE